MKTLTLRQFVAEYADIAAPRVDLETYETAILEVWASVTDNQGIAELFRYEVYPWMWAQSYERWRMGQ